MEDKALVNENLSESFAYLYDGTNQTTMQKKNILEIAGQQIIGRNSKSLIVHTKFFFVYLKHSFMEVPFLTLLAQILYIYVYVNFCHSLHDLSINNLSQFSLPRHHWAINWYLLILH